MYVSTYIPQSMNFETHDPSLVAQTQTVDAIKK